MKYKVYIRTGELGSNRRIAYVGFYNENIGPWETGIARVFFVGNGTIKVEDNSIIQTYEPNRWYKVKVIVDINSKEYNVWINDVLKAEHVSESDADKIRSFILVSEHAGIKAYFDDVKVSEICDVTAIIEKLKTTIESSDIHEGIQNSLLSKIESAEKQFDKENFKAGINKLEAAINEIEAQKGKKISEDLAALLIGYIEDIIRYYEDL